MVAPRALSDRVDRSRRALVDRHERHVIESKADPALRFAERDPLATADIGTELATPDVDPNLRRRTLEDDAIDRALDDIVEGPFAVGQHVDVLRSDVGDDRGADGDG